MKPVLGIIAFKFTILLVHAQFHDGHYDFWLHSSLERSVDVMVDVVNDLGVRILQQHVSPGNVAFSPTGVGFVLIALYEGSAGRGRHQIAHALGLPRRNQITRIGMRDINRRLRSYLNADGFLGGLTLNKENINLRPEYEDVLRFYGFDLAFNVSDITSIPSTENAMESSTTARNTVETAETASNRITMAANATPSTMVTETPITTGAINNATDTVLSNSNTSDGIDVSTISVNPTTTSSSVSDIAPERISQITTQVIDSNSPSQTQSTTDTLSTTERTNTTGQSLRDTSSATNNTETLTMSTMGQNLSGPSTANNAEAPTTSVSTTIMEGAPTVATQTAVNDTSPLATLVLPGTTDVPPVMTTIALPVMRNATNSRRKRSAGNADGYFSNYQDDGFLMQDLNIGYQFPRPHGDYDSRDETHISFLVNGCDVISVPAATYTTILPFAYFPSLKAIALEFPLDDPRYNIIMFLPTERVDTIRLVRDLSVKTLRLLRNHLQSTWVKATIPTFMLRGFVILTPFLQRLGIRDVFEPRVADLSFMTPDLGVYTRDVQQSIAVNIRGDLKVDGLNSPQSSKSETSSQFPPRRDSYRFLRPGGSLHERAGPASFIAEHPFVYFIIDAHTSVSLIAGRVDDPLNSRIL